MLIKTRNFSTAGRQEVGFDEPRSGGFGWAPGYVKKFQGMDIKKERFDRNYNRMQGVCTKCSFYQDVDKADGSHCKRKGRCEK